MESNLGRLEIKLHMVGVEQLDLNTRVGGSLSKNGYGKKKYANTRKYVFTIGKNEILKYNEGAQI